MKIVIPGGSGHVGNILRRAFLRDGHEVILLSRRDGGLMRTVLWDGESQGEWAEEIDGADVVINLAGRSVNCRYGAVNRREIMESRVNSTRAIGKAIANASAPPRVWLQAGTATIYTHTLGPAHDESNGVLGGNELDAPQSWRFSIDVARAWERELEVCETPKTRKVILRSAITMSPDRGGPFDILLRLVRFGLGGPVAGGRQYVSWIHELDFVRCIRWLIDHDEFEGPVNLASPNPLPYRDFMKALRTAWGARIGLPATAWMVELGCLLMRTESELVLKSRRVAPGWLLTSGFDFQFPVWPDAAADLVHRWRAAQRRGKTT